LQWSLAMSWCHRQAGAVSLKSVQSSGWVRARYERLPQAHTLPGPSNWSGPLATSKRNAYVVVIFLRDTGLQRASQNTNAPTVLCSTWRIIRQVYVLSSAWYAMLKDTHVQQGNYQFALLNSTARLPPLLRLRPKDTYCLI
jgi:hypothetical protein